MIVIRVIAAVIHQAVCWTCVIIRIFVGDVRRELPLDLDSVSWIGSEHSAEEPLVNAGGDRLGFAEKVHRACGMGLIYGELRGEESHRKQDRSAYPRLREHLPSEPVAKFDLR